MTRKAVRQAQQKEDALRRRCPLCKAHKNEPCVKVGPLGKGESYPGVHPERKR